MQRYFAKERIGNELRLGKDDLFHIQTVMRMKEQEQIEVVYEQELFLCCLENVKNNIHVRIVEKQPVEIIPEREVVLIIPVLKEQKMDLILQKSTELGVSKIIVTPMKHCMVKVDNKIENKLERWNRICKEASEQSKRLQIPIVTYQQTLSETQTLQGLNLLCSTKETKKSLKTALKSTIKYDKILVVMGPEGGFAEEEEAMLQRLGFESITLGSRILRVETVPMFLLSVLNYESME